MTSSAQHLTNPTQNKSNKPQGTDKPGLASLVRAYLQTIFAQEFSHSFYDLEFRATNIRDFLDKAMD